ncbi:hypothetical protein [Rhodonellum psychrophilum]
MAIFSDHSPTPIADRAMKMNRIFIIRPPASSPLYSQLVSSGRIDDHPIFIYSIRFNTYNITI